MYKEVDIANKTVFVQEWFDDSAKELTSAISIILERLTFETRINFARDA